MFINSYQDYLVTDRKESKIIPGKELYKSITQDVIDISPIKTYEVYLYNKDMTEPGWEIEMVKSTDSLIKEYPLFDCIISTNDHHSYDQNEIKDFLNYYHKES